MQFFPAVLPQGAHFSRPSSTFEMTDSRPGQDFGDLLSSRMDQPKETARAAQSDQHQASSGHERPLSDERDIGNRGPDESVCDPDQSAGERNVSEADADQVEAEGVGEDGAQTAKPAESGRKPVASEDKAASANEARGHDLSVRNAERASDASGSAGRDEDASDEALAANIQALLDGLAGETAAGRLDSGTDGIKVKIDAMHELLRQFRNGDPAERSELAVTLGEQIRELKAELAALAQTRAASSKAFGQVNSGQTASGKVPEMDAILERLKVRLGQEKGGRDLAGAREDAIVARTGKAGGASAAGGERPGTLKISPDAAASLQGTGKAGDASAAGGERPGTLKISPDAAASLQGTGKAGDAPVVAGERPGALEISPDAAASLQGTGKAGDAPAVAGERPGTLKISPDVAAAAQGANKDNTDRQVTAASRSVVRSGKKSGAGSDIAMRAVSGEKVVSGSVSAKASEAGSDGSGGKTGLIRESVENFQGPEARSQEGPVSGTEHKVDQTPEQNSRQESMVSRNGLPAAKSRDTMPKDAQQSPTQEGAPRKQEVDAVSGSNRSADFEGGAKQRDARQGFFAATDREKTSSSTLRPAKSAGGEKGAVESLTHTTVQNSQTPFQQRLEAPVSARSAQVYQQVENGAFKSLGQGVKQLVIRLDPADLGQVSVILQVRGKEVQAVLRSSSQEASAALNDQLGQLRSQLESQGLKVGKLEVQTQLADSQSQSQWQGAQSHNRYQENQELAMSARRWRSLERVAPDLAQDVHISLQREKLSQSGLDIFA